MSQIFSEEKLELKMLYISVIILNNLDLFSFSIIKVILWNFFRQNWYLNSEEKREFIQLIEATPIDELNRAELIRLRDLLVNQNLNNIY